MRSSSERRQVRTRPAQRRMNELEILSMKREVTLAAWRRPLEEIVRPRLLEAQEALRSKGVFLKVGEVRNDRFRAEENGLRPPHFALEISNISNVQKYEFYSHKDFETPAVIVYCVDDSDRSKSAAAGFPPLVLQVAAEKLSVEQVDKIVELGLLISLM